MFETSRLNRALLLALALGVTACGPSFDGESELSRSAIHDEVNKALSQKDCSLALTKIEELYASANTDNETRLLAASTYACFAGVNLFKNLGDIASNSAVLGGAGVWGVFPAIFPSTTADRGVEGAGLAMDALMAAIRPGWLTIPSNLFNTSTTNPGSILAVDRIDDANSYMVFVTMASIGTIASRHGVPNADKQYTVPLPWTTVADFSREDGEAGCQFASSIVNFMDVLEATSGVVSGNLKNSLQTIHDAFKTGIDAACDVGCQNVDPPLDPLTNRDWKASGCPITTACAQCPLALRDRRRCTADTTGSAQVRCAAAGVVNFIVNGPAGWANAP